MTVLAQSPPPSVTTPPLITNWLMVNGGAATLTADARTTLLDSLRVARHARFALTHFR